MCLALTNRRSEPRDNIKLDYCIAILSFQFNGQYEIRLKLMTGSISKMFILFFRPTSGWFENTWGFRAKIELLFCAVCALMKLSTKLHSRLAQNLSQTFEWLRGISSATGI